MQVVHFNRKRRHSNYSIEGFYSNIRNELNNKINIKYIELPFYSNGFFRRLFNAIYAAFEQGEINHVTGDVNFLNLFFRKNKNIITILDCVLLDRLTGLKQKIAKLFWYTIPIKRAKFVVAISQSTKDEILKYVKCDPDKIKVIHVSVSPIFRRTDKEFNKENPVILHIGTDKNKNLDRLVQAITGLNCKLNIIGLLTDEDKGKLLKNKIVYENFYNLSDEEVFEQFKLCDLLAFVSTYEGFGMPIIEANTVGRPVITSNLLSMPEVAGNSAITVDPYNISEIREGILKIIDDDHYRNRLIKNGFGNAKRFELSKLAEEYYSIYLKVFNNKI